MARFGQKEAEPKDEIIAPRDADVLRAAGAMLGALWVNTVFKAGPHWEARCDLALDEAERLIKAYDRRQR